MYFVYVLENSEDKSWYIGFTDNVERRVREHDNKAGGKHTRRKAGKWEIIYYEAYIDKRDALGREKFLKGGSGRKFLKRQLTHFLGSTPT